MTAILLPDPVATVPSRVLDPALIAAFGLIPCPAGCDHGTICVLTSESGDVDFEECRVCHGLGVVTGDRRDDPTACPECRAVGFAHACAVCRDVEVAA